VSLENASILDVGCGMGENLISLSKKGARCFGIDISKYMIRLAEEKVSREDISARPSFQIQDMRSFTASYPEIWFDLILSIYSFEYLLSIKELRDVFAILANRLKPNGVFAFCFSHPLQHFGHANLQNETASASESSDPLLIYSFRDVVTCLAECGLTIDRILEQGTRNPSKITYERGQAYPYHFKRGKNPCIRRFDELSNRSPHTVIYKARKPAPPFKSATQPLNLTNDTVRLWNQNWDVKEESTIDVLGRKFLVAELKSGSEFYLCCQVLHFEVTLPEILDESDIYVPLGESSHAGQVAVKRFTLLAIVLRRLRRNGLHPIFSSQPIALVDHPSVVQGIFLRRVDPLFGILDRTFPRCPLGVLVFVNMVEPGSGKVGLDSFVPRVGDSVDIIYIGRKERVTEEGDRSQPALF
jgi:SAM-dependent methyltransferase